MATWAYPPLPPDELKRREDETQARELRWLLTSLQESLGSLKDGLEECVQILKPDSTLVLSSLRSEVVKGWVRREGGGITKGDITLRLSSHPQAHHVLNAPLALPQLRSLTAHLNSALDIIDVTRWTGDPTSASFISGQLRLLSDCLADARGALRGGEDVVLTEGVVERDALIGNEGEGQDTDEVVAARSSRRELKKWFEEGGDCDPELFAPPLPASLSLTLTLSPSSLVLTARALQPYPPPQSLPLPLPSLRLFSSSSRPPPLDAEGGGVYEYNSRGGAHSGAGAGAGAGGEGVGVGVGAGVGVSRRRKVTVKEKVRVESPDPSLLAVEAKLSALGHEVGRWCEAVRVVGGEEE